MSHFSPHVLQLVTNLPLIAGYTLYGINTLMMVLALKNGEMSLLYPIIALTYVWTTLLSYTVLGETPNLLKDVGIVTIVVGVAVMGRRGQVTPLVRSMMLVFTASVIGSLGMAFLKMGSAHLTRSLWTFLNPKLLIGVGLFLGSSVFYAWGIKDGQLSVLYPMVSLGYVWGLWWAKLFFNEALTKQKFMGLGLILLGVCFVGLGS